MTKAFRMDEVQPRLLDETNQNVIGKPLAPGTIEPEPGNHPYHRIRTLHIHFQRKNPGNG